MSADTVAGWLAEETSSLWCFSGKKFDIRQFVLVTSLNPLTVFLLDEFYLRFSTVPYTVENLTNRFVAASSFRKCELHVCTGSFIHLTNHQVQKDSYSYHNSTIVGNQWSRAQFKDYLR